MKIYKIWTFFTVLFLSVGLNALAEDKKISGKETYIFDKAHTNIIWSVSHMGFSDSIGQFMDYEGRIILDFDNPAQSHVKVAIQTASMMTGLDDFDAHLKSADFFDVEKYPTATFVSKKVTITGDNKASIEGDFTMLGKTHPLTMKIRLNRRAMDIQKNVMRTGFSVRTKIKRSLWGMKAYVPFVGDEVAIKIEAEALRDQ